MESQRVSIPDAQGIRSRILSETTSQPTCLKINIDGPYVIRKKLMTDTQRNLIKIDAHRSLRNGNDDDDLLVCAGGVSLPQLRINLEIISPGG